MPLEHEELTDKIIGAAIEVHRSLGPGFLESIYENALVIELRKRGLHVDQQLEIPIYYNEEQVGLHRIDIFVEKTILLELKAIKALSDIHYVIARSYLRALNVRHGLILNFAVSRLQPKRVMLNDEWN